MLRLHFVIVGLIGIVGCTPAPSSTSDDRVMTAASHTHYHVHGPEIDHGHTHADFTAGGHTHAHDGH